MQHVREFKPSKEKRILVVSPHPDDEVLGCGALLLQYHDQIDILLCSDGEIDSDTNILAYKTSIRLKEFDNVVQYIGGVNDVIKLHLPVYGIKAGERVIRKAVDIYKYDYVFVPHNREHHKDHRAVCNIFKKIVRRRGKRCQLIQYESTTALQLLYWYIDLSDATIREKKRKMMEIYESQTSGFDYDGIHMGLSKYQGALIHKEYAEVYYQVPKLYVLKKIFRVLPNGVKVKIQKYLNK